MTMTSPSLSVTGVKADHARRAVKWLRKRSILAFYRKEDRSLNILETKFGPDMTYEAMDRALKETVR
jgi:hypothetical protein